MTTDAASPPESGCEIDRLTTRQHFREVGQGIGVTSGLALLWVMEAVRNRFFALLDALKIPARRSKHGVPYPPGKGRNHRHRV